MSNHTTTHTGEYITVNFPYHPELESIVLDTVSQSVTIHRTDGSSSSNTLENIRKFKPEVAAYLP